VFKNDVKKNNIQNMVGDYSSETTEKRFTVGLGHTNSQDNQNNKVENKNHEYNIGSKVLPAIGVLSILIGSGFFLKDYLVLGYMERVILGFVLGITFIAIGDKIRERFTGYSTFLIGGGFSILYLSAKFGLIFNLYSNAMTFILMLFITVSAILISYKLESRIIAFVALIGGFISPILASSGLANELGLFNYILILLNGMFFLA
jgi:uncharacterized membrane protein